LGCCPVGFKVLGATRLCVETVFGSGWGSKSDGDLLRVYVVVEGINANFFVDEASPKVDQVLVGGHIYQLDGASHYHTLAGHKVVKGLTIDHPAF
jgi:hypothetical protein